MSIIDKEEHKEIIQMFNSANYFFSQEMTVEEMTIVDWSEHFSINIPKCPDIVTLKLLLSEVAEKIQECSNLYSQYSYVTACYSDMEESVIDKRKSELLKDPMTKVSAPKATSIAQGEYEKAIKSRKGGQNITEFFNQQLRKLKSVAEKLDTLSNLTMSEAKNMNRYIPGARD